MRSVVLLALVGCGRLAFESNPVAGDDALAGSADGFVAPCTGPDEDNDLWPNDCDNCPTEPSGSQSDGDSDGVGDVCDPRPTTPGDLIELFDPFDAPNARYQFFGSDSYVGGALRLGDLIMPGQAFFDTSLAVTRIDIAYEVVDVSQTDIQWTGVWSQITLPGPSQIFSEAARDPANANIVFRIKEMSTGGDRYSPDVTELGTWSIGERYRTIMDTSLATGGDYRLTVTRPGGSTGATTIDIAILPGVAAFLESEKMVTDFVYLIVYAAP